MKLKTLKAHYHETEYKDIGSIYMADKVFGTSVVKNGICKEIALPKKKVTKKRKK